MGLKRKGARTSNAFEPDSGEAESGFPTLEPPSAAAPRRSTIMQLPRKMSAHTVMASISRTLERARHSESRVPANEVKLAGEESKDRLYEPKHKQKLFRVLTVVAYIISVSLAAIVLSLYYMYIWDPSDHPHYILIAKRMGNSSFASNSSALGGAAAGVKICSNDGVGVQQGAGSDQVEPAVDAVRYDAALDKSKLPIESSDNTPAYVAAVIGERPSEPRLLGVMGLLKKLSSNNQPETPPASKNQQKDQYRLSKDTSESPILNRLPDYEEELAGTSELPDLVED